MAFSSEWSDYKRYIRNAAMRSTYINVKNIKKIFKNNEIDYEENDNSKIIKEKLAKEISSGKKELIESLEEYEYEKHYKYSSLYSFDVTNIGRRVKKQLIKGAIKTKSDGEYDNIKDIIGYPNMKKSGKRIDIKFSYVISSYDNYSDGIKLPIIASFFRDLKLVQIKFDAIPNDMYIKDFYVSINNKVKNWIKKFLGVTLTQVDTFTVFKEIIKKAEENPSKFPGVSEFIIRGDDDLNGRTDLRADDQEKLPLISYIMEIAEKFHDPRDKDLLDKGIKKYKENLKIRKRGIKWRKNFGSGRESTIIVVLKYIYKDSDTNMMLRPEYIQMHFYSGDVNRERMDYVISFISEYLW